MNLLLLIFPSFPVHFATHSIDASPHIHPPVTSKSHDNHVIRGAGSLEVLTLTILPHGGGGGGCK